MDAKEHHGDPKKKKRFGKDESFLQQVTSSDIKAFIDAVLNYLNMRNITFLLVELYHPVETFDEKLHICETCHKHLYKMKFHVRQSAVRWR